MLQFLANELIFEILCHFLPGLKLSVTEAYLFPWYLGKICSRWRSVFISSPQFWSKLDIDMDRHFWDYDIFTEQNSIQVHELVKMALERSNDHPLSLSITMYDLFEEDLLSLCSLDILEILVSHSMRWKYLSATLDPSCYSTLYQAKGRLPILRSLMISSPKGHFQILTDLNPYPNVFEEAPQLTRISSRYMTDIWIDWSLVTELHLLDFFFLDEAFLVLCQTSVLEKLVLTMDVNWEISPSLSPPVQLPSLKELYLSPPMPLEGISTPGLEILHVMHHRDKKAPRITDGDIESLTATLSGYFHDVHNLKKLAISASDVKYVFTVFETAPSNTEELKLYHKFISRQLEFVAGCPNLYNIKAISIMTSGHEISQILATFNTWVQPFKQLAQFSLYFTHAKNLYIKQAKRLKRMLAERGINFISKIITESELHNPDIPSFESEW